jgi:replicative DNA helicase
VSGSPARFRVAADIAEDWIGPIRRREQPEIWPLGGGFGKVEIGPGLVLALGGAPASGKTGLALQWITDALRARDDLLAVVLNVEMSPASLLERTLARVSGVSLSRIRKRELDEQEAERLEDGFATIATFADRLAFVDSRFTMSNLAATLDAFAPGSPTLVLADYVQRIAPPDRGKGGEDGRAAINATMSLLREFAMAGCGVIVCSSVSRSKDRQGRSTYAGEHLGLASFRESGEVEFGGDSAYLLVRDERRRGDPSDRLLRCVKNRHGREAELPLDFDGSLQRFTVAAGSIGSIASTRPEEVAGDAATLADLRRYWRGEDAADASEADEERRDDGE